MERFLNLLEFVGVAIVIAAGSGLAHFLISTMFVLVLAAEYWPILSGIVIVAVTTLCQDSDPYRGEYRTIYEVVGAFVGVPLGAVLWPYVLAALGVQGVSFWNQKALIIAGAEVAGIIVGLCLGGGYRFRSYPTRSQQVRDNMDL